MKVPVVGALIAMAMAEIDAKNAQFYLQEKFPLTAVATVRMQSEVWEQEIKTARASQPAAEADSEADQGDDEDGQEAGANGQQPSEENNQAADELSSDQPNSECEGGEFGLGTVSELISTSAYESEQCPVDNPAFGAPATASAEARDETACG